MVKDKKVNKKISKKAVIIVAVCLIAVIGAVSYFIFGNLSKLGFKDNGFNASDRGGNFQPNPITEEIKNEITSFFESFPSSSEIEEYCNTNINYCMYYCMDINKTAEICSELNQTMPTPNGVLGNMSGEKR